jgi:RNA polymerase sigma-70 factor (ECF subfamily)
VGVSAPSRCAPSARSERYDPTRSLRGWVFAIASHAASDYRRLARHRREVFGEAPEGTDGAASAEELLSAHQEGRLVRDALESVELERRAVLVMHDMEGLPVPGITSALEIPLNTAYSRLRLGRRDLVASLQRLQKRAKLWPAPSSSPCPKRSPSPFARCASTPPCRTTPGGGCSRA